MAAAKTRSPSSRVWDGDKGAGDAVMGGGGHALRLSLGQGGVGGDDGDGGGLAGALAWQGFVVGIVGRGGAEAAEFGVEFPGRGPEMRVGADGCRAERVDGDEGTDGHAVRQDGRGRTEAAFQSVGQGTEASACCAEGEVGGGGIEGGAAEAAVGVHLAPVLVAAVQEVEQDRAGDNRHADVADGEAAPGGA